MKMKVYDTANRLAEEIKTSEEYITYKTAKEVINLKPELKEQIKQFEEMKKMMKMMSSVNFKLPFGK